MKMSSAYQLYPFSGGKPVSVGCGNWPYTADFKLILMKDNSLVESPFWVPSLASNTDHYSGSLSRYIIYSMAIINSHKLIINWLINLVCVTFVVAV